MLESLLGRRRALLLLGLTVFLHLSTASATPAQNDSIFVGHHVPVAPIKRKHKPRRRVAPKSKPVMRAPYLAVQLKLFKLDEAGTPVETQPQALFHPGDRLRLAVRANQRGYLTIIHQEGPGSAGQMLFPTSRINNGGNYVDANRDFVVPSNCPAGTRARDCAYTVPDGGGRELFTIIFSRDSILDLPESATTSEGPIPAQVIDNLEKESPKLRTVPSGPKSPSPYAIIFINDNKEDNEEIVKRFPIFVAGGAPPVNPSPDELPTASPTETPTPVVGPDSASPTPIGKATIRSEPRDKSRTSGVLIILGVVGIAGVVVALVYIYAAGKGLGR